MQSSSSSIGAAGVAAVDAGEFFFSPALRPGVRESLGVLKPPWGVVGADCSSLMMLGQSGAYSLCTGAWALVWRGMMNATMNFGS